MIKKIYTVAVLLTIVLSLAFVGYGTYINVTGASNIAARMNDMTITLYGARAEYGEINPIYECSNIMLYPSSATDVIAQIDGVISKIHVQENDVVNEGQTVFQLVNEKLPLFLKEIESELTKANALLHESETNLERSANLLKSSAISKRDYEQAALNSETAKAEVDALRAKKERALGDIRHETVTAPYNARVLAIYKDKGTFVAAGHPLLAVGDMNTMIFENRMPDEEAQRIISGDKGYFMNVSGSQIIDKTSETKNRLSVRQDKMTFEAHIAEVQPSMTTPAQFRTVRWSIDNSSMLLSPGIYENVLMSRNSPRRALVIPKRAFPDDKQNLVHTLDKNEKLVERHVVVGAEDEFYAEILSGLEEGDRVIISDVGNIIEGENRINLIIEK